MRIGKLTLRLLGFQNNVCEFYIKNNYTKKWARIFFPFEKPLRGEEAAYLLCGFYLSSERRMSGDVLNDTTNVVVDKKFVREHSALQRIQLAYCVNKMRELEFTLADVQFILLNIDFDKLNKTNGEKQ